MVGILLYEWAIHSTEWWLSPREAAFALMDKRRLWFSYDYSINKPLVQVGLKGIRMLWVNGYEGKCDSSDLPSFCTNSIFK